MKTFLIIGSNSFSGMSFVINLLNKNHKVIGLSRSKFLQPIFIPKHFTNLKKNYLFKKIDLNENLNSFAKIVNDSKIDYVINFAAQGMVAESWDNPIDWYKTNFLTQTKMYDILLKNKKIKKIINFSTPEVYGNTSKSILKENYNFNPSTPYAVSRSAMDLHLKIMYKYKNLPIIITRTSNIYGPYQQLYRIIPKTIIKILLKQKLHLHGNGLSQRSFIYNTDVNDAINKIILRGKIGNTYHISTNDFISIKNLIKKICKIMDYDYNNLVVNVEDRKGKDNFYKLESSKIRNGLGWKDQINLDQGLNNTITWVKNNLNQIKKMSLEYKHKK